MIISGTESLVDNALRSKSLWCITIAYPDRSKGENPLKYSRKITSAFVLRKDWEIIDVSEWAHLKSYLTGGDPSVIMVRAHTIAT